MLPKILAWLTAMFFAVLPAVVLAQDDAESSPEDGLSGVTGWAADVIVELGEFGVFALTFIETVFPPIPSEIVLSLAGYLAEQGRMNVVLVVVAATAGAVLGALVLYWLGLKFGEERAKGLMARIPLVEMADLAKASSWFERHGQKAVFFGRFIPLVRSLVSLPAGAQKMALVPFIALTTIGSGIWNSALVGAGYALGTQYEKVEEYTKYLDYVLFGAIALGVAWFVVPRLLRKRRAAQGEAEEAESLVVAEEPGD
jgi:membrane protein DedA with SNARE-associated domain